ncbi:hypothetical protein AAMO2058_001061600 [Amorphochlora amoebiformis]
MHQIPLQPTIEDHGIREWIDTCIGKAQESSDGKDQDEIQILRGIVSFLRTQSVDTRNQLQRLSSEITAGIPATITDIQNVTDEAKSIQEMLRDLMSRMDMQESGSTLGKITPMQRAKRKMELMSNTIQEVENWNAKLITIESVFETHDITSIGKEVAALHKSCLAFQGLSDFKERVGELEKLKDRVEVAANPHLLAAIDDEDNVKIQEMMGLFASMGREGKVRDYFFRSRLGKLDELARQFDPQGFDEKKKPAELREVEDEDSDILQWLPEFFKDALAMIKSDSNWASDAFKTTEPTIAIAYLDKVCNAISLKILSRLRKFLMDFRETCLDPTQSNQSEPTFLPQAFDTCATFAKSLIELRSGSQLDADEEAKEKADSKDSNATGGKSSLLTIGDVIRLLMSPLLKAEEWQHEMEQVYAPRMTLSGDLDEIAKSIAKWTDAIQIWASEVTDRCVCVTGGARGREAIEAMDITIQSFLKKLGTRLDALEQEVKTTKDSKNSGQDDEEVDDLDQDTGTDWGSLASSFIIFEQVRKILPAIQQIEANTGKKVFEGLQSLMKKCPSSRLQDKYIQKGEKLDGKMFYTLVYHSMLMFDSKRRKDLSTFQTTLKGLLSTKKVSGTSKHLFQYSIKAGTKVIEQAENVVFSNMTNLIHEQLNGFHTWGVWTQGQVTSELPSFSLQPSDYITKIGEHMLSLVQHLEPVLDGGDKTPESQINSEVSREEGGAHYWLTRVTKEAIEKLENQLTRMHRISNHGKRQLKADIGYLANVVHALDVGAESDIQRLLEMVTKRATVDPEKLS